MVFTKIYDETIEQLLKDFCEEYTRLVEMIILFDPEKKEKVDEQERFAMADVYRRKGQYAFLGENGVKQHFDIVRARIIKEIINENEGVKIVYKEICSYVQKHKLESDKLGLNFRDSANITPMELYQNYQRVVSSLSNLNLLIEGRNYQKK